METNDVVKAIAALAKASSLEIFRALVVAGTEGMTPSALSDALGVAPNTLSFHLKELTNAGLVAQESEDSHLIYRAQFERMNALMGYLTENCCQGQACLPAQTTHCAC